MLFLFAVGYGVARSSLLGLVKMGSSEWRFGAGYFDKIKDKSSGKFISMSTKAGAMDGAERGVYVAAPWAKRFTPASRTQSKFTPDLENYSVV